MNEIDRRLLLGAAGVAGMAAAAGFARGGPLSPPEGSVASTGRTLLEVEPRIPIGPTTTPGTATAVYRITQPGSYYLTGNVQGVAGKHGIQIEASDVTVDLMGFEVKGTYAGGPTDSVSGVNLDAFTPYKRTTVMNGTVSNWSGFGVALASESCLLQNIAAVGCGGGGMGTGNFGAYVDCSATGGVFGFNASPASTLCRCRVSGGTGEGFILNQGCVADACTAMSQGGHGFRMQGNSILRGCAAYLNAGDGFHVDNASSLIGCSAYRNSLNGIAAGSSSVLDCLCTSNNLHGIVASGNTLIRGNICDDNGASGTGYGISVTGSHNRIEANHCTSNDQGINVSGSGNLIIRNSVSGNSGFGYAIAANNSFGPNVVPAGNQIATSTNPHSNYEF
jgi:parallel beta-helix repeat protein